MYSIGSNLDSNGIMVMFILLQVLRLVTSAEDQPFQISVYPVFKLATFLWTRPKLPLIGLASLDPACSAYGWLRETLWPQR